MNAFAKTFTRLLEEREEEVQNYSRMGRYTGMSTSTLFRFHTGERKPTNPKQVDAIADYLRLDAKERKELEEAFYVAQEGEYTYYSRKQIQELIGNFSVYETHVDPLFVNIKLDMGKKSIRVLNHKYDVRRAISSLIFSECAKEEKVSIYTNRISQFLVHTIDEACTKYPNLIISHIFLTDNTYAMDEHYQLYNIKLCEMLLPMGIKHPNYEARYCYGSKNLHPLEENTLCNALLVGDYTILFSSDYSSGIITDDPEIRLQQETIFRTIEKDSKPYFSSVDYGNEKFLLTLHELQEKSNAQTPVYGFINGLCLAMALKDQDPWAYSHLAPDFDNRDAFLAYYFEYIRQYKEIRKSFGPAFQDVYVAQGLDYFVEEGLLNEIHPEDVVPFDREERIAFLKQWREVFLANDCKMIDLPGFPSRSSLNILATPKQTVFLCARRGGITYTTACLEPEMSQLFYSYIEHVLQNHEMEQTECWNHFKALIRSLEEEIEQKGK